MLVRLAIDFENDARRWWDSGGQDLWDAIREGFDGGSVVLEAALAESWLAEAARIPGWCDGPDHAPHPIRAERLAEGDPESG